MEKVVDERIQSIFFNHKTFSMSNAIANSQAGCCTRSVHTSHDWQEQYFIFSLLLLKSKKL